MQVTCFKVELATRSRPLDPSPSAGASVRQKIPRRAEEGSQQVEKHILEAGCLPRNLSCGCKILRVLN